MKISEKSWHYRFYSFLFNKMPLFDEHGIWISENPRTLCSYFWSQVFIIPFFMLHWLFVGPIFVGVCAIILIIASPFLLIAFIFEKSEVLGDIGRGTHAMIKARKDKVCPFITYTD